MPNRHDLTTVLLSTFVFMVGPGGTVVKQVLVQKYPSSPPRQLLRVRGGKYYIADCRTVAEVARLVDLATLVPGQR